LQTSHQISAKSVNICKSRKRALSDDDLPLSICPSVANLLRLVRKLLNESTWKFMTVLGQWKSITGCSIMTSSQIQDGGRPLIWKSSCRRISVKNDRIITKFDRLTQIVALITMVWVDWNF